MSRATEGRVIAYRPAFATIAGSVAAGVFLAQIAYWQGRMGRAFYKPEAEWRAETGLSRREYANARRALREAGLLTERAGFRQVRFFRLDLDALEARLAALGERHEPVAAAPERVRPNCGSSHGLVELNESVRTPCADSVRTPCANSYQKITNHRLQRGFICPVAPDERAPAQSYFRVDRSWADAPADTAQVAVNEAALVAEFDALYDRWPRREKRGRSRRAFLKAVCEGLDKPTLLEGFERALSAFEFEDRQFVPMFSAWLADERWHDEHDDDEPADAPVAASPPAAAGYHRPGAARPGEDSDTARWRARGRQILQEKAAQPRNEAAGRVERELTEGDDVQSSKLDQFTDIEPGYSRPEAARPAPEAPPLAPPPPKPEAARSEPEPSPPAPEPSRLASEPEAALAPGERELTHAEHVEWILAGKAGPALARGERRSAWPAHLRDEPKPLPPDPSLPPGSRELTFAEVCALQDAQRAERAALRAERCAARRRPAPQPGAFA